MYLKIILIATILIQNSVGDISVPPPDATNAVPYTPPTPLGAPKCNVSVAGQKKSYGLQFHLPFMDMEIQNQRHLYTIQEPHKQQVFVLHGTELFQMFVGRQEKRLSLIGMLAGSLMDAEPLGAEVISWHNYLIIVVALEEYLEIYQIAETIVQQRAEIVKDPQRSNEQPPSFEPIQQLTLLGKYQKLYLIEPQTDEVMLVVAVNFTRLYGRVRTFGWTSTYFDPIEELTVPPVQMLSVVGTFPKYVINCRTIKHQSQTIISVYEIQPPGFQLRNVQTLTVSSRTVQAATYRGKNYIFACSSQQKKCNTFRMADGQFNVYKQRTGKELAYERFVAGAHFLVGSRLNEIMVFTNARLDCYGSFETNDTDVSSILTLANAEGENYILIIYRRPFHTLVRMVEIETESGELLSVAALNGTDPEDVGALKQHQHIFEDTIGKLRSLLLQRRAAMDVFRQINDILRPKLSNLEVEQPVHVHGGNIGIIKIEDSQLLSPVQLMNRMGDMNQKFRPARFVRSPAIKPNLTASEESMRLKVQSLRVQNLIYEGSIPEGFHLDNLTLASAILCVRPPITTKVLHTPQLFTRPKHRRPRQVNAGEVLKIEGLNVQRINDVSWQQFHDMLFLRNRDTKIQGRLVLQAETKVVNLVTPKLNALTVDELFNLKQPQVVNSDVLISRFFVSRLQAEQINGLDFAEDIVFSGQDILVETPVKMYQMSIAGDLLFTDNTTFRSSAEVHLPSQFNQYYTGKVTINGTLTLEHLQLEASTDKAQVLVGGTPFSRAAVRRDYLLKHTEQVFNKSVTFGNAKVTAPQLSTTYLNDHPTNQHLLQTGASPTEKPLFLVFMSANVAGDLICKNYNSKLMELHKNAVMRGEVSNITGWKIFEAPLTTDHLMTLQLNELPVSELVLKSQLKRGFKFKGSKSFDTVLVTGEAYVHRNVTARNLNNLPLAEFLNYNYNFERLHLSHELQASNVVIEQLNGINFDNVFAKLFISDEGQLLLHKDLIFEGNVKFDENLAAQLVNDVDWETYQGSLVRVHENSVIQGQKRFMNELTVTKQLQTPAVNGQKLEDIFANILSKSKPQLITGEYAFENLRLTNLDAALINGKSTAEFIDLRSAELVIEGDIIVPQITVHGSINGNFTNQFQFASLAERLGELPKKQWRNIVVLGSAAWNTSTTGGNSETHLDQLQYLLKNAVSRTRNQTITGNVNLKRPLISKMETKGTFPSSIDLDFIARDCLRKNGSATQVISGGKTFLNPVRLQKMTTTSKLGARFLNEIDILRLNASLYRLTSGEPVSGPLHFLKPPQITHLAVEGLINGMKSEQIYHLPNTALPPIRIHDLVIDNNLQLSDINDMNLNYMLENRVTKQGAAQEIFGFLTFENLVLNKVILLQSINGMPIDNLVFKQSKHLQALIGTKVIEGNLLLAGPAHVMRLNGHNLIESYQQSVFTDSNHILDNLTIDQGTFLGGLVFALEPPTAALGRTNIIAAEKVNNRDNVQAINRDLADIISIVNNSLSDGHQNLLYLDYDFSADIRWEQPNETIDTTFVYESARLSMCARQLVQVQHSKAHNRFFLNNSTTNFITANALGLSVKAENYCKLKYRKVKSKITLTGRNFSKVFGMKKYIENVQIYSPDKKVIFVLLHAIAYTSNRNEVRVLKIDSSKNDISDWQSISLGVGEAMRLFQFPNYTVLLSAAVIKKHPALSIYQFAVDTQQFELEQVIDGDYDIMEMAAMAAHKYQLILGCRHCQRIHIYERNGNPETPYQILQMLKLNTLIDKLLAFSLSDGTWYLLVLSENEHDYYYLYKYMHIQGWLQATYGYFHNIHMALPLIGQRLEGHGENLLLLLCGHETCNFVRALIQH